MTAGTAKYVSVRDHLARRIKALELGDRLPSEQQLCDEYRVSRITVRRAVEELVREGRLVRQQGRGTFVAAPKYREHHREAFADAVLGFYRQQASQGRRVTTKVLTQDVRREPRAAAALGMSAAEEFVELERLRYVNGVLHQHGVTWLSVERYPHLLTHDFSVGSLYDVLEQRYGVVLVRNELVFSLAAACADVAAALGVAEGTCLMAIQSTVYDTEGQAVAFGVTHNTPETSEVVVSIGPHT